MAKEVLLMADVAGLGKEGDVVRVHDGYARNFLLPKKLAAAVTDGTRRQLEKRRQERETRLQQEKTAALELVPLLEKASCTIRVKTGEGGKLFGSVTVNDIVKVLKTQGVNLGRHQVELPEALRELGTFTVPVTLHPEVKFALKVWVVEE